MSAPSPIQLCDIHEARAIVGGLSRSSFYEAVAAGRYPQPVRVGPHSVRWVKHELEACVRALLEARPPHVPRKRQRRR